MEQAKYDEMQGMLNKLEDIKNSQESIIDKINHVITDLFQNPDKDLEKSCLLYTSPSPRDRQKSRMPSSA